MLNHTLSRSLVQRTECPWAFDQLRLKSVKTSNNLRQIENEGILWHSLTHDDRHYIRLKEGFVCIPLY